MKNNIHAKLQKNQQMLVHGFINLKTSKNAFVCNWSMRGVNSFLHCSVFFNGKSLMLKNIEDAFLIIIKRGKLGELVCFRYIWP